MIAVTGVVLLLLSRGHYSIDCLLAYWVTSRVWWTYHTLANNSNLQEQGGHNHLDNIWWWWLLRWAEANVPGQLPRRYSLPAPASVQRAVSSRWRGWRHGEGVAGGLSQLDTSLDKVAEWGERTGRYINVVQSSLI